MRSIFTGHDQGVRPHGTPSSGMPTPGGATAVLDRHLRFTGWSREAEELFGLASEEVLGRSADAVLADTETGAGISSAAGDGGTAWSLGPRPVRRGDGRPVSVSLSLTPLALGVGATGWLLVAVDSELAHWEALGRAMLDGLDRESPVQLVIYDTDARVRWINAAIEKQFGISLEEVAGRFLKDILPQGEVLEEADRPATSVEEIVQRVARTGSPVVDVRYRSATFLAPHHERVWSCSYFRLQDEEGRPIGVCEAGLDITDRYVARQRLALLSRASGSIGRTLDIRQTAGELAELVVPEFAEAVIVDIFEPVLSGEEPRHGSTHPTLCRVAHRTDHTAAKDTAYDELDTVSLRCLAENAPATDAATRVLALPLKARGTTLGVAAFARPNTPNGSPRAASRSRSAPSGLPSTPVPRPRWSRSAGVTGRRTWRPPGRGSCSTAGRTAGSCSAGRTGPASRTTRRRRRRRCRPGPPAGRSWRRASNAAVPSFFSTQTS